MQVSTLSIDAKRFKIGILLLFLTSLTLFMLFFENISLKLLVVMQKYSAVLVWQKIMLEQGSTVFQNSRCHLQILGAGRVMESMFHTVNSEFLGDVWISLLCGNFAQFMWTDTHFCVWQKETCSNCAESMRCHLTKFSCLCIQVYGFVHNCVGVTFFTGFISFLDRLFLSCPELQIFVNCIQFKCGDFY